MKPTSISYSESKESFDISTGLKSWRKAGMEAELQDGDIYEDCYKELQKEIANVLNGGITVNPDYAHLLQVLPIGTPNPYPPNVIYNSTPLPTIDYSAKEKVEKAIDNATSDVELMAYINDAITHGLVKQYVAKKQTFEMKG